jgi:tetratricopeptide (TPR) repeat protein
MTMFAQLRRSLILGGSFLLAAGAVWAQTATLQGEVKDANGQPLKGAVVVLDRKDIKGHYQVKTDKKGHWLYTGLPLGQFDVSLQVDGKEVDKVSNVKASIGDDNPPINFDMHKAAAQQAAMQQAASTGQLTDDQQRGMSKEQKEQFEAAAKQRAEAMKKNKALNDAFNAGQDALKKAQADTDKAQKAADYKAAADSFTKASELDANQPAVWDSLGAAEYGLGGASTGDDKTKAYDQAIAAYQKEVALKPDAAGAYNQIGNIYGAEKKIPEATEALQKAAQLDPQMAGKAYFNMGANLVNSGQGDKAIDFFKKATDADPNYAEAWYQMGSLLMAKGSVDSKTGQQTYPPDTAPALQKYLALQPTGPHAQEATAMLSAMGEKVQTNISVPGAKKKK